jgi:hypothetical protein
LCDSSPRYISQETIIMTSSQKTWSGIIPLVLQH